MHTFLQGDFPHISHQNSHLCSLCRFCYQTEVFLFSSRIWVMTILLRTLLRLMNLLL